MAGSLGEIESTTVEGRWGRLRPLVSSDVASLYRLQHDESEDSTWREMKVGPFANQVAFAAHVDELLADPHRAFFAIASKDDAPLGWLCLMEAQPVHRSIELGYVLFTPPLRRTTLATEAFYLAMTHVFDTLGHQRLEWTCTATNLASRKAADRLGFVFEGLMRSKLVLKGVTHDIPLYSMLAGEWSARRLAMQRWLDPANFDQNGQQRTALGT
ncbi:MAG: GNAT family protein [Devosia sp.]